MALCLIYSTELLVGFWTVQTKREVKKIEEPDDHSQPSEVHLYMGKLGEFFFPPEIQSQKNFNMQTSSTQE